MAKKGEIVSIFKHEAAIVDDGARIGEGTEIWRWVHISSKAVIGQICHLL